jgi:polyphosphate glucokinase
VTTRLGIDFGGTGIKGALVDLETGELATERVRIDTPRPSSPDAVAAVVAEIAGSFEWSGPVGVAVPAVVVHGVTRSAANIDPAWVGLDAAGLFSTALDAPVTVLNDADAAGVAEMSHGAGRGEEGTVLLLTIGTGVGSALFVRGALVPNTELGHLEFEGAEAEDVVSGTAREAAGLSWEEWVGSFNRFLRYVENLLWPDLVVLGGGGSKEADQYLHLLESRARLTVATLRNDAGIVGAAMAASGRHT